MAAVDYTPIAFNLGSVAAPGRVAPTSEQGAEQIAVAQARQGQAGLQMGQTAVALYQQFDDARQKAAYLDASTKALVAFQGLDAKYAHDTGYADADKRYQADAEKLKGDLQKSAGLDPVHRAHLDHTLTQLALQTGRGVTQRAWSGQQSQVLANLDNAAVATQTRYLAAGSPVERAAVVKSYDDQVALAVAGGWIDETRGVNLRQGFRRTAEYGEALRLADKDPQAAVAALANPKNFASLDPAQREAMAQHARNQIDQLGALRVGAMAQASPAGAAATVGKAFDPATVASIYDKGVIPQESGGRADAVSPAGALGVGQLMPGTARMAAQRMGRADIANLPDDQLRQKLLADPTLNRALGLNEFQSLVTRYGGDIPAALAGYNAGPGNDKKPRADAWRAQAIAKFGPNYTAEQFASVIPIKETRDYVLKIYERLGARLDAHGLSEEGRLRAQSHVAAAINAEGAQNRALLARMAADAVTGDPIADALKAGQYVDPGRIAAQRQILSQAALAGDAKATAELRQLTYAEEAAPIMAQAYRLPPAQLATAVAQEEARLANGGGSPAESRRLDVLKTVLSDVQTRADKDPIGLAARAGMFQLTPVPVDQPQSKAFSDALAVRAAQAPVAASMYGGALLPLRPAEADALRQWWGQAQPGERVNLAMQFAAHLPPGAARAAMKQVSGQADSLTATAGQIALRAPATAQKIMTGVALLEGPAIKPKVSDVRAALGDVMRGQIYASPRMQNDAVEAGLAIYAANRAASGALFDPADRHGIEAAIQEVTGPIVSVNGARVPLPPGIAPAAVTSALSRLTAADFEPFGGLQKGIDPAHVAAHAQLHALELGGASYALTIGDRPVMDASGTRPLIVDLAALASSKSAPKSYATPGAAFGDIVTRNPVAFK